MMWIVLMEVEWCQDHKEHRDLGFELYLHESVNHGVSDEIVPIHAAIYDEAAGDDPPVTITHVGFGISPNLLSLPSHLRGDWQAPAG